MKKRKKFWAIDLGEALTKIVVGEIGASGWVQIEGFRIEKTPEQIRNIGNSEEQSMVRGFLRHLLKGARRHDDVMLVINHKEMLVASFTFPMMTINEVEEAIYWQLQLLTSENLEFWRIDFQARERTRWFEHLGIDETNLDVLGVAVKKDLLSRYTKLFGKTGCRLASIVPQFYTFDSLIDPNGDQPTLIIDMGKSETRFFYYYRAALVENHRLELETGWDGKTYLREIIKVTEQIFEFPLGYEKTGMNDINENIYLMGGESLHRGVLETLTKWLDKKIRPVDELLDEKEELILPGKMTKAQRCLMTPCVCGLIKQAQLRGGLL